MVYSVENKSAGDEVSSTYEGRHLTFAESVLTHPTHADGLVDKGDPVVVGSIVGVAFKSAAANTDLIAIDTEGIWVLTCTAEDYSGNSAIAIGDRLYIDTSGVISKDDYGAPYGYALTTLASGYTDLVVVKVHAGELELAGA